LYNNYLDVIVASIDMINVLKTKEQLNKYNSYNEELV
jgi:hypothetical protein